MTETTISANPVDWGIDDILERARRSRDLDGDRDAQRGAGKAIALAIRQNITQPGTATALMGAIHALAPKRVYDHIYKVLGRTPPGDEWGDRRGRPVVRWYQASGFDYKVVAVCPDGALRCYRGGSVVELSDRATPYALMSTQQAAEIAPAEVRKVLGELP